MQHASDNWWVSGIVVLLALIIIFKVSSAQGGNWPTRVLISVLLLFVIGAMVHAGLNAIDEAVGRATEMGRPVMMVPGISGLDVVTLQALSIFGYIARAVARFGNKSIIPTIDPIVTGVAEETLQDAYADAGRPELYDSGDVRYLTGQQFAFASGVAGILIRSRSSLQ